MSRKVLVPKETVKELYEKCGTVLGVASALGVSETVASRLIHEAGITPKIGSHKKINLDVTEIDRMYQEKSLREIAKHYGIGETTVWSFVKQHGIAYKAKPSGKNRNRPERSEEHRRKQSEARKGKYVGEKAGNWKGGVSYTNMKLRQSKDYARWKKLALKLRGDKCQQCGVVNGIVCKCCGTSIKLHVHHIKSFAKYPESRFDPENSEVLCPSCHHSRHRCKSSELLETP